MASPLQRLPTNVFSTGAGYGLRVAIAFFFVPFITGVLGDARYGVWVLVFQVVNYFFLFDFGMERAVARFVPQALARRDFTGLNRVLNSATAVYAVAAVLVLASAWAVLELIYPAFEISDQALRDEGRLSLLIISVAAAIRFATFPLGGSLGSVHRFDIAKGLEMAEEILKTAVFVWLLLNDYGLVALALTIAILTLVRNAVGFVWLRRLHREIRVGLRYVSCSTVRLLLGFSRVAFAAAALWLVIYNSDSVILGFLISSAAVGIYAPGAQVLAYARQLITALILPLAPIVSHVESTEGMEQVRAFYLKFLTYAAYLAGLIGVGLIVYAGDFVGLWLPEGFQGTQWVMFVFGISALVFLPHIVSTSVLFAVEKHRYLVWILAIELAAKTGLALSLLLALKYQDQSDWMTEFPALPLVLMASAGAFPQIIMSLVAYPIAMARALRCRIRSLWQTQLVPGALAAALTAPAAHAIRYVWFPDGWLPLAANVILVVLVWLAGLYLLILEPDDRLWLKARITGRRSNQNGPPG